MSKGVGDSSGGSSSGLSLTMVPKNLGSYLYCSWVLPVQPSFNSLKESPLIRSLLEVHLYLCCESLKMAGGKQASQNKLIEVSIIVDDQFNNTNTDIP